MACLEACDKYRIPTVFVPTLIRGYNDREIGRLVELALTHDFVTSVTIQPAANRGAPCRHGGIAPPPPV